MSVKLYDIRDRKYPNKRGDIFRSLQVFECWVCGAKTNKVIMGGWPGWGIRVICPNSAECWHHELEDNKLLVLYHRKRFYISNYRGERYCEQKQKSQKAARDIKKLHKKNLKNDVVGKVNKRLKRSVTNVRSHRMHEQRCKHGYSVDHLVCQDGQLPRCGCKVRCNCPFHTFPKAISKSRLRSNYFKKGRTFFDPHPGLAGATIPIPAEVKRVAEKLNEKIFSLKEAVTMLQAVTTGCIEVVKEHRFISLNLMKGGSRHTFRVISYR